MRSVSSTLPRKDSTSEAASELRRFWQRRKLFVLAALLAASTLLLYNPAAAHKFINLDDNHYVTQNPHVVTGLTAANIRWAFHTFAMGNWNPLTWLSHMLDCQLYGLNPAGHHYTSVLLHAANVLLLFLLLAWATGAVGLSFVAAALFAVHPLNVETVAWISERKTLLCTLFFFLTFAAYGWYARARSWGRYLATLGCFVLSLMAKPMSVTLPVALLILDYWPLGRLGQRRSTTSASEGATPGIVGLIVEKLPFFLVSLGFSVLAIVAQSSTRSVVAFPLARRVQNAVLAYVAYIGKAFWPARLSVFYPYPKNAPSWLAVAAALLLLAAITALCLRLRSRRYLLAGWLFFLVSLLPVIGLIQVGNQAMADRYAYTPLIGLFVMLAWGLDELRAHLRISARALAAAALGALLALAAVTHVTLGYWQNSLTLFLHARQVAREPNELIETNLGEVYYSLGRDEEALRHYRLAIQLDPQCYMAHYDVGNYLLDRSRPAESVAEFQAAIRDSPSAQLTEYAQGNLGEAFLLLGNSSRAEHAYAAALRIAPRSFVALLGHGQALLRLQRYKEAEADFSLALTEHRRPELFLLQGMALEGEGKFDAAMASYRQAQQMDPKLASAPSRIDELQQRMAATPAAPAKAPGKP